MNCKQCGHSLSQEEMKKRVCKECGAGIETSLLSGIKEAQAESKMEPKTEGEVLSLLDNGTGEKTPGWNFEFGSTGLYSFGDGQFYVSHDSKCENGFDTHVKLYRWDGVAPLVEE